MRTRHLASLSLALTLGAASLAAAQSTTTPAATETVQSTPAPTANSRPRHRHRHRHHHSRLFRGVHLTTDQRAKLSTIREQYRTQARPLFRQMRTARHAVRSAARTDTAAVSTARATMRDAHAKFASLRTQWMTDARGVLTPDQQTQFDKNAARRHRD